MDEICQSCGMPMKGESMHGTKKDGAKSEEYCVYCFKEGEFTVDMNLEEFIEKQVDIAKAKMNIPEEEARSMAKKILPNLKRWRS